MTSSESKLHNLVRQATYVKLNNEARSRNYYCRGKELSSTYSESVFIALGIQHAMRMRHIVFCGLPGSTTFFNFVCFLLGNSPASEFYTPTFRNTLSVPSL